MSINPVLGRDGASGNELFPLPLPNEIFVLKRGGIIFKGQSSDKTLNGTGKIFLTSNRLVFLRDGDSAKHKNFSSIELPLHLLSGENRNEAPAFKQPFFGANYLQGRVEPAENAPHPLMGTTKFTLTFNEGGCQTFLRAFYRLHKTAVRNPSASALDPGLAEQLHLGPQAGFCDPSDPSTIYVTQPVPTGGGQEGQAPPNFAPYPPMGGPAPAGAAPPGYYGPPGGGGYPPQGGGPPYPPPQYNNYGGYPPPVGPAPQGAWQQPLPPPGMHAMGPPPGYGGPGQTTGGGAAPQQQQGTLYQPWAPGSDAYSVPYPPNRG